jgi:peptidoglycan/LPS O-acetylase OafA/YrhL
VQQRLVHRPDIDGLRGIAILAVLAFDVFEHALRGGHLGIDVLFVVSGYLLSRSILDDLERGTFDLLAFYRRRLRRALPALLLVSLAVLALGWFTLFAGEYRQLGGEVAAAAAFASNFLAWSGRDGGESGILHHLSSLALLAQFCLLWPLVLKLSWHHPTVGPRVIAAILVASFGASVYLTYTHATAALYAPISRAWEPMAGWALVHLQRRGWRWEPAQVDTAATFGGLLLAICFCVVDVGFPLPGWRALLPVFGTAIVISAGSQAWLNRSILSNGLLVGIGLISYPLYLWHWPPLAFAYIVVGGSPSYAPLLALLVLSFVAAIATHLLVERPIRRRERQSADTVRLSALAIAIGVLGCLCYAASGFPGTGFRDPARQAFVDSFARREPPVGCTERCTRRDPEARHAVLLWGDAQAAALYGGLKRTLPGDWQILQVTRSRCIPEIHLGEAGNADRCETWNRAALGTIAAARPDVVVVAYDHGQFPRRLRPIDAKLHELGIARTLFAGPAPHWSTGLPTLVARRLWRDTPRRTFVGLEPQTRMLNDVLERYLTTTDTRGFLDIMELFCDERGCLTYLGEDRTTGLTSSDESLLLPIASDYLARERLAPMITGSVRR